MLNSMEEIIAAANGGKSPEWFSQPSMHWFGTLLETPVYPVADGAYFVTSERDTGADRPRKWSVRFCSDDGSVETIGEFQQYETSTEAHRAARGVALAVREQGTDHS